MNYVNNFITDLLDEMVKRGASHLMIKPGLVPTFVVRGENYMGTTKIDSEEFIEDLTSLGISLGREANVEYFHHTDNEFVHKMRIDVSFEGIHDVPVIMARYVMTMLKTELEERNS